MSIQEIITSGGAVLFALATVIQIVPIKINPWSAIAKALGKAINADVLEQLKVVKEQQREAKGKLEDHIRTDDKRDADLHRTRILQFNTELLRDIKHTREDFIEALVEIDEYESYCKAHPEYENNRAVHAISNIKRVYDERLEKHDFLQ